MPENISKEWNDLRTRVDEMVNTEKKVSKFECKQLCTFNKLSFEKNYGLFRLNQRWIQFNIH